MSKKSYDVIPIKKNIEPTKLFEDVLIYIYSHLGECEIEKKIDGNNYTAIFSPKNKKEKKRKINLPYITMEMIIHKDSCAVYLNYSKAKPALNAAIAVAAAPIFLPTSGILLGTAGLRLWRGNTLKNDVIRYIKVYVS